MGTPSFLITDGKGFRVTFASGWAVSVQFGWGNYCNNHDFKRDGLSYEDAQRAAGERGSMNAELALIDSEGNFVELEGGDTVVGGQTPAQMLTMMTKAAVSRDVPHQNTHHCDDQDDD